MRKGVVEITLTVQLPLDIAFEGLLLHDDGFVGQLMEETRRYVETQGIRRTETGGWRFPVEYRQATVLKNK